MTQLGWPTVLNSWDQRQPTSMSSSEKFGHHRNVNFLAGLLFIIGFGHRIDYRLADGQTHKSAICVVFDQNLASTFSKIADLQGAFGWKQHVGLAI
jgi:hypothetical protein